MPTAVRNAFSFGQELINRDDIMMYLVKEHGRDFMVAKGSKHLANTNKHNKFCSLQRPPVKAKTSLAEDILATF